MLAFAPFRKAAVLSLLFVASLSAAAQTAPATQLPAEHVGLPIDWSHRYVIYTKDDAAGLAAALRKDPRYFHSWQMRHANVLAGGVASRAANSSKQPGKGKNKGGVKTNSDWAFSLGDSSSAGSPAKWTFDINANPDCTNDYVAYGLLGGSSPTVANLMLLNNLYSGPATTPNGFCKDVSNNPLPGPTAKWSFRIRAHGTGNNVGVANSMVTSLDGTKLAFVTADNSGLAQIFHILTLKAGGDGNGYSAPAAADEDTGGGTCTSGNSCDQQLAIGTLPVSSPYVDFFADVAYLLDGDGSIYRVNCVFRCGAFPTVDKLFSGPASGVAYTDPVLDQATHKLFFGDSTGVLYAFDMAGSTLTSIAIGNPLAPGPGSPAIVEPPLVDPSDGYVFVFTGDDSSSDKIAAVQVDESLTEKSRQLLGAPGLSVPFEYDGTFDDLFYNNITTGHLYACGVATNGKPKLYRMPFNSSGILQPLDQQVFVGTFANNQCRALTEIKNTTTGNDWLFMFSTALGCTDQLSGNAYPCIESFDLTQPLSAGTASTRYVVGNATTPVSIVVDNVANTALFPQASSIYFVSGTDTVVNNPAGPCGDDGTNTHTCAIKLTQQNLQ